MCEYLPDNESNILLEDDDIQASKVKAPIYEPKKRRNLDMKKVAELVKNNIPVLELASAPRKEKEKKENIKMKEEAPMTKDESNKLFLNELLLLEKKERKKRKDTGIHRNMDKARAVRDANRKENMARKIELQNELDKQYQETIIKKAVAIKKKEIKRQKAIEAIPDEPISEPAKTGNECKKFLHSEPSAPPAKIFPENPKLIKQKKIFSFY